MLLSTLIETICYLELWRAQNYVWMFWITQAKSLFYAMWKQKPSLYMFIFLLWIALCECECIQQSGWLSEAVRVNNNTVAVLFCCMIGLTNFKYCFLHCYDKNMKRWRALESRQETINKLLKGRRWNTEAI